MRLQMYCMVERRTSCPMDMIQESEMVFANVADLAAVADDEFDGGLDRDVGAGAGAGAGAGDGDEEPLLSLSTT